MRTQSDANEAAEEAALSNLARDICTEDLKITQLVDQLRKDKFLIPTFQREFVWLPANILKLWDSIFRFYPIGSILYWETDSYLHTHRKLGGFSFPHDEDTVRKFKEWKYILDGQQRATSLLVSMLGGKGRAEDNESFDYTLFFDAARGEFLFADEVEKREAKGPLSFLVRVRDVPTWGITFYKEVSQRPGFNDEIEHNLQQLQRVFTDYKIPVVRIQGVEVNEVCEIFERINQEGKRLDPVDIIVARTYRNENPITGRRGFYLRDYLVKLKQPLVDQGNRFQDLDDLTVLQMVALCLRKEQGPGGRHTFGITPVSLNNLRTEHLEENWDRCERTIYKVLKLASDLSIKGPGMLPFVYLLLPLTYYLHKNPHPDLDLAHRWFWRYAFGLEEFRASTDVYRFCEEYFTRVEGGEAIDLPPLTLSKAKLIQTNYNYRNSFGRAVMAFLASLRPLDFSSPRAVVLDDVYLLMSQAPNLHHIYPQNFMKGVTDLPRGVSVDSLMNICFIRADTNIRISDRNPLEYFRDYDKGESFEKILASHLIPRKFIDAESFRPGDYREFLLSRAGLLAEAIKTGLRGVEVRVED